MSVSRAPVCVECSDSHSRAAVLCWRDECRWCAQMPPCCVCRRRCRARFTRRRRRPVQPVLDVRVGCARRCWGPYLRCRKSVHVGAGAPGTRCRATSMGRGHARGAVRPCMRVSHARRAVLAVACAVRSARPAVAVAHASGEGAWGPRCAVAGACMSARGSGCTEAGTPRPGALRAGDGRFVGLSGPGLKKGQLFRLRRGPGRRATLVIPRV
jgi:hypothetical protein